MRWGRVPLVPLAVAFAGGIVAAPAVSPGLAWAAWGVAVGVAASCLVLGRPAAATALLLVAVAALGILRATPAPLPPAHVARLTLSRPVDLVGRVAAEPRRTAPGRLRALVEAETVDGEPRSGRVQVTIYGEPPPLAPGQRVRATLRLHPARGFRNPGGFDYGARLRRQGLHVAGSLPADRLLTLDAPAPPWPLRVKRRAIETIEARLPPVSAALLGGLLLRERSDLPREIHEHFRRSGTYHVLAVSGFHVGILAAAVFLALRFTRASPRLAACVAIPVVAGFACVVGPEPSVLRATVMAVLVLSALLLDRDASVMNSLALAAILILAVRPGDLHEPGFQLSFAATAGIVAAPLPRGRLGSALGVSVAAQLAVLPVMLVHFHQLTSIAILANLAVVPLAAVSMILGLAALTLSAASTTLGGVVFDAAWPALLALRAAVALAAAVPGALVHLPAPPALAVVLYTAALVVGLGAWHARGDEPRRARLLTAAAATALAVALAVAAWPLVRPPDGRLRLTVLDVGQGDGMVLETPDGRAMVVDAGGGGGLRLDAGERVVAPYLWSRGFLRLAAAVTTHADLDHAGGMPSVGRLFWIREQWSPERPPEGVTFVGPVAVVPLAASLPAGASRNETALVLRIEWRLASFLLTSDIGVPAERALLAASVPLDAVVLKVGHHGSRHSSSREFLAAVRPTVAVVSVGARNPYGHPAPQALARVAAAGARLYRTDQDGAVILETDGRVLTVTRWATGTTDRYCLDPEAAC
jgi:competence protein ComEC